MRRDIFLNSVSWCNGISVCYCVHHWIVLLCGTVMAFYPLYLVLATFSQTNGAILFFYMNCTVLHVFAKQMSNKQDSSIVGQA
jgi:hypothetical protein